MAVLALVSAAILTVPTWIWADCCCVSDSPEVATTVEQSSCCHTAKATKTVAPSSRLPRVKSTCECEASVATWHATIPERQVLPELDGIASISSEGNSTFSARDFPTERIGTEVIGRSGPRLYVLLCHWLA